MLRVGGIPKLIKEGDWVSHRKMKSFMQEGDVVPGSLEMAIKG